MQKKSIAAQARFSATLCIFAAAAVFGPLAAHAAPASLVQDAELRADRYIDAATVARVARGTPVETLKSDAGWVQIRVGTQTGWVRANLLSGPGAAAADVAKVDGGRTAGGNIVATSGIRSMPRAARHALIIGIGEYANPAIPSLKGVKHDMESARKMATAMSIPPENIRYIRDLEATAARIEQEIAELNTRTQPGDRVFLYYSGHGSRWYDANIKKDGCVEALMPSDAKPLTNEQVATMLKPISDKTDKLLVFYDACHSGGIVGQPLTTRSVKLGADKLTPKFSPFGASEVCAKPANIKTRGFIAEAQRAGGLPQNIVQISSSRPDEVSFDDEARGGLATQAWRDCMLGEARDLDGSGGITVDEIAACVQTKLDVRFASNTQYAAQHVTIGGNKSFIPGSFSGAFATQAVALASQPQPTPPAAQSVASAPQKPVPVTAPATQVALTTQPQPAPPVAQPVASAPQKPAPVTTPATQVALMTQPQPTPPAAQPVASTPQKPMTVVAPATQVAQTTRPQPTSPVAQPVVNAPQKPATVAAPAALAPPPAGAALTDIFAQRDARRQVTVQANSAFLQIGKDALDLSVTSSHEGYVYMVLLGSDNKSFYMLFPNDIDRNNVIKAGETLKLPRKDWEITAQGPAGTDKMLVVVTESPRDLSLLGQTKSGPFLQTLTDDNGRANLQWLLGTSMNQASTECSSGGKSRNLAVAKKCSDAFGAALAEIVEK